MALANLKRERAARMIAEDLETDHRIATAVKVSRRTIQYWKKRPDVMARVQEIADRAAKRLDAHYDRLESLQDQESCRMSLSSRSELVRRAALIRLREMGAL